MLAGATGSTQPIGGGSFGTVYRARHLELEREVAVKVLATSAGTDPEALARFRREGISACRVQHPNAVAVLDFGVNPGGVAYLVMELLAGPLAREGARGRDGRLTPAALRPRSWCRCASPSPPRTRPASSTATSSRRTSSCTGRRSGEVPKILDFGIAKMAAETAARARA